MTGNLVKVGHIIMPAGGDEADLDAALSFYVDRLGMSRRFRDGVRYAAVSDGPVTLGLAGPSEQPVAGQVVVSVEVRGLDSLLEQWRGDGLEVEDPVAGPHERRAVVLDPAGNPVVVYERDR